MKTKTLTLSAVAIATLTAASLMMAAPASAKRKQCVFMAWNPSGHMMADGWAKAKKLSKACKRAKKRCNRELNRKRKHGKAGRGGCKKVSNLSD